MYIRLLSYVNEERFPGIWTSTCSKYGKTLWITYERRIFTDGQRNDIWFSKYSYAAEFIYYLKKYNYQGVVFFDTFPIRENAKLETQANINSFEKISKIIDEIGMDRIAEVVSKRDGVEAQRLVLDMLK